MGVLFAALDMKDSERAFTSVEGAAIIWEETQKIFERWNADKQDATAVFVQEETDRFKERYELPGGGELEEEGFEGNKTGEVKPIGSWDVAYPLTQYGRGLSYNDIALAYLTVGKFEAAVQTVLNQNNNTEFRLILQALFNNNPRSYTDRVNGALTISPLANNDSVAYPPVYGATTEAPENFYLSPNYLESGISNTNDPSLLIKQVLEPHYGFPEGGSPIVLLVSSTAVPYFRPLASFDAVTYFNVVPGANVDTVQNVDGLRLPGGARVVGVANGVTIAEWPRIPTGWMIGYHLDSTPPLKRRVDPKDTGLAPGLQLVTQTYEHPFHTSRWRNRVGYGVGNRLGAVCIALNGTTTYTVPPAYQ